ncbi:hypothetical protein UA08_04711 [Talaromyces atroroseus]|uniref:Uncharacterized protein n=1 Tax=Talaromyces atroroseus TaxID=1441469 RepID=A0A225AFH5_TALAT|nr:hypothetical protein UA08_04711 [Talaromyces atroroseus]OKL60082.1 hypothetical protein UA08_04711 [Talaromyces atroroseus]
MNINSWNNLIGSSGSAAAAAQSSSPTGRRNHAIQPPALTTSLNVNNQYRQSHSAGATLGFMSSPATSLSSPFSQHPQSAAYLPSPGAAQRGTSPMPLRLSSSSYGGAPYNPQEWGPMNVVTSPQTGQVAPSRSHAIRTMQQQPLPVLRSSDNMPSPPPPYTPRNQGPSPPGSASLVVPPSQAQRGQSNDVGAVRYRTNVPQPRPLSMVSLNDGNLNWQSAYGNVPPPPPPPPPGTSRSSSRADVDRQQNNTEFVFGNPTPESSASSHRLTASQHQAAAYGEANNFHQLDLPLHAPSSKRAASAGALQTPTASRIVSSSHGRSSPRNSWEPGMPLPPPPPGPPPAVRSRSASSTTSDASSSKRAIQAPRPRAPPVLGTSLGQVPPTPADWVDEDVVPKRNEPDRAQALHIDTEVVYDASEAQNSAESSSSRRPPSRGGLFRSFAVKRDSSAKGIRERRIEKHKRQQVSEDLSGVANNNGNPWETQLERLTPANLVLNGADKSDGNMSGRRQGFPNPLSSARSAQSDEVLFSSRSRTSSALFSGRSSFSTPKPDSIFSHQDMITPTPPFSPQMNESPLVKEKQSVLNSKPLPSTPPSSVHEPQPSSASRPGIKSEERPVSHLLHIPNDIVSVLPPLSPRRMSFNQPPSLDSVLQRDNDPLNGALQRYQAVLDKEAAATDDSEALRIFMDFIVSESQIRRKLYARAFADADVSVEETRKKLFTQETAPKVERGKLPSMKLDTSFTEPGTASVNVSSSSRPETMWWNNYQPCLSPIASISIENDESSRGRPPSRWWESKTGSSSEGVGERKAQRSKRESKYMGVPREVREEMQMGYNRSLPVTEEEQYSEQQQNFHPGGYGPNEYPPEKVGLHEPEMLPSQSPSQYQYDTLQESHYNQEYRAHKMDISRLVTLPPPYPRHHPAVNNSHPDLVVYRTTVRSISDLSEVRATREHYEHQIAQLRQEYEAKVQENRRIFRSNIQQQIQEGSIKYAEAAEAEAALEADEQKKEKELVQSNYDTYQSQVMEPMHLILSDRVGKATERINELSGKLKEAIQNENPDHTQEEGDEKPEILEQLTQLKWLFEARELLHREIYDLLGESNEKYRAIVTLPYKQTKNEEKLAETDAFFVKDSLDRRVQFEAKSLARVEAFMDVVEENVRRGVETHLSAFWDIAPSLLTLVQQIPENLSDLQIEIPAQEYEENPSYYQFPLQYLYSLLSHAEKSSYQFIESQTNLLCLLHEVRSGVMVANCRLMEAQRTRHGEPEDLVRSEMQEMQAREERELTADLKEKVSTVEGQWTEALGSHIESLRERVKSHLLAEDGWDDTEQLE